MCGVKSFCSSRAYHTSTNFKMFLSWKLDKFTLFTHYLVGRNWKKLHKPAAPIIFFSLKLTFWARKTFFGKASISASYPDVSLLMKMCAQRKAGRRQRAKRLADLVFKMAARVMADQYAIFKISSALFICEFWANHCLSTSCVWRGSCFYPTHWTQAS